MAENSSKDLLKLEAKSGGVASTSSLESKLNERPDNFDIEVLSGNESNYIEMDLMLGIADLHTPEAVAAAESAMAGHQQPARSSESSSGSEDEDSSDDEDDIKENKIHEQDTQVGSESVNLGIKDSARDSSCQKTKKQKPKKRPKIVELA